MTNDEKLQKKNWSEQAQKLDDLYSDKYFKQSTCIIPFGGFGMLWISTSWIAQFSNFYHDGKWPDKTQEEYNQFYDSLWKDIINPKISGDVLYTKYFSKVTTKKYTKIIMETAAMMRHYSKYY
jgi:hypothetical protein